MRVGLTDWIGSGERKEASQSRFATLEMLR
jgi:hypothetical protein